jgi:cell division protein FtsN
MKKADLHDRSSVVYIGKGIIILSIVVTASLGFILGFLIGKNYRFPAENQQLGVVDHNDSSEHTTYPEEGNGNAEPLQSHEDLLQEEVGAAEGENKHPAELQNDTPGPAPEKSKSPPLRKYTVQVGAFRDIPEAESLQSQLTDKGYTAVVVASKTKKQETLYKVMVGKFSDREDAEKYSLKLRKTEGLKPFVTFRTD